MPNQSTLRVLTFEPEPPDNLVTLDNTVTCDGTYRCRCANCVLERNQAVKRGVRASTAIPVKIRKAA